MEIYGFWIKPSGEIITLVDAFTHIKVANDYVKSQEPNFDFDKNSSLDYLYEHNWIRIIVYTKGLGLSCKHITEPQLLAIFSVYKQLRNQVSLENFFAENEQTYEHIHEYSYIAFIQSIKKWQTNFS